MRLLRSAPLMKATVAFSIAMFMSSSVNYATILGMAKVRISVGDPS
jgi:hypothetical protein